MKRAILFTAIFVMVFAVYSSAQLVDRAEISEVKKDHLGLRPASKPFSLIDLSRVKWSHSYSVSFFSGGGVSGSIGLYTGSLFYELSSSLSIDLRLSVAHNPGAFVDRNISSNASLYPAVNLDYHPSENFRISVGFISYPGIYYDPNYYYSPYHPYRAFDRRHMQK